MLKTVGTDWELCGQKLQLLPQKAIYWVERETLIVSDLHLGKVGHFRKAGIAIPRSLEQEDLAVLSDLIHDLRPKTIVFLGDLFHSDKNNDWDWFQLWKDSMAGIRMILVKGNHDIIDKADFEKLGVKVVDRLLEEPFFFTHEPVDPVESLKGLYNLCGHIHPAVNLKGRGRTSIKLSCFYFGKSQGILPAFGKFTGNCILKHEGATVFAVVKEKVISLGTTND